MEGGLNLSIPFLFFKTIEKVFLSGIFKEMDIFHVFQLSLEGGGGYIDP